MRRIRFAVVVPLLLAIGVAAFASPVATPAPVVALGCDPTNPDCGPGDSTPPDVGYVTVSRSGGGASHATITSSPSGINCGTTCSAEFALDEMVTLSASLDAGWSITGWSGCTSSSGTHCATTATADGTTVTATIADATPPSVSITAPAPSSWQRGSVPVAATASDSTSGIASVEFLADGASIGTDTSAPYGVQWATGSKTGTVTLTARANDRVGNQSASSINVNLDNAAPSGAMTAPAEGDVVDGPITLTANAADVGSGISEVNFVIAKPGGTLVWTPGRDTAAPWSIAFDPDHLAIADGEYRAYALLSDVVGNGTTTAKVSFWVDRAAPTLSMSAPADGAFISSASADLSATATDAGSTPTVRWSYRPEAGTDFVSIGSGKALSWNVSGVPDGTYIVRAMATDGAGRSTAVEHRIHLDRQAPTASISPLPAVSKSSSFTVAWSGTDPGWDSDYSGVNAFDVRYRKAAFNAGTFGPLTTWLTGMDPGSFTFDGKPGTTYCFSTRDKDWAGHVSGWSAERCTSVPVDDRSLTASPAGAWARNSKTTAADNRYFEGTYSRSKTAGATLVRGGIQGTRVAIVVTRCPTCGTLSVLWDGSLIRTVNLTASTVQRRAVVTVITFNQLRFGTLTLKVGSGGRLVEVDGIAVVH